MSGKSDQPVNEPAQRPPQDAEHKTGYVGYQYPWMTDLKGYKAEHSKRHMPLMFQGRRGGKR